MTCEFIARVGFEVIAIIYTGNGKAISYLAQNEKFQAALFFVGSKLQKIKSLRKPKAVVQTEVYVSTASESTPAWTVNYEVKTLTRKVVIDGNMFGDD